MKLRLLVEEGRNRLKESEDERIRWRVDVVSFDNPKIRCWSTLHRILSSSLSFNRKNTVEGWSASDFRIIEWDDRYPEEWSLAGCGLGRRAECSSPLHRDRRIDCLSWKSLSSVTFDMSPVSRLLVPRNAALEQLRVVVNLLLRPWKAVDATIAMQRRRVELLWSLAKSHVESNLLRFFQAIDLEIIAILAKGLGGSEQRRLLGATASLSLMTALQRTNGSAQGVALSTREFRLQVLREVVIKETSMKGSRCDDRDATEKSWTSVEPG
jgi:hypothetical protein